MAALAVHVLWAVACLFAFGAGNCWGRFERGAYLSGLALALSAGGMAVALSLVGGA